MQSPSTAQFAPVRILQGGMGVGISTSALARTVACAGKGAAAGTVSDTLIANIAVMRLAHRDPAWGRALRAFRKIIPEAADLLYEWYWGKEGRIPLPQYHRNLGPQPKRAWPTIFGSFANVLLAAEGHSFPIGVNVLEKVQQPHLECFMGLLLAMTLRDRSTLTFVVAGAGFPGQFPRVLSELVHHRRASYTFHITRREGGTERPATRTLTFALEELIHEFSEATREHIASLELREPPVLGIVSTYPAVRILEKQSEGRMAGYVVENYLAGGHNAPPRNKKEYGPKDEMDLEALRALGKPFWLAGNTGSPAGLQNAREEGAHGIQCGSIFAMSEESGFTPDIKRSALQEIARDTLVVERDERASPTVFPFNIAHLASTAGKPEVARQHKRSCDIGHLREEVEVHEKGRTKIMYRCSAEPVPAYEAKHGKVDETMGRMCLCRKLLAASGAEHHLRRDHHDIPVVTFGIEGPTQIRALLRWINVDPAQEVQPYPARHVVQYLLGPPAPPKE